MSEIVQRERQAGKVVAQSGSGREPKMRRTAQVVAYQDWLFNRARVYRLSEPVRWEHWSGASGETRHVVVSTTGCAPDHGGPEAMAFACDDQGEMLPGGDERVEVGVAYSTDHDDALREMGFTVLPPATDAKQPEPERPMTPEEARAFAEEWNAMLREAQERYEAARTGLLERMREHDLRTGEAIVPADVDLRQPTGGNLSTFYETLEHEVPTDDDRAVPADGSEPCPCCGKAKVAGLHDDLPMMEPPKGSER